MHTRVMWVCLLALSALSACASGGDQEGSISQGYQTCPEEGCGGNGSGGGPAACDVALYPCWPGQADADAICDMRCAGVRARCTPYLGSDLTFCRIMQNGCNGSHCCHDGLPTWPTTCEPVL